MSKRKGSGRAGKREFVGAERILGHRREVTTAPPRTESITVILVFIPMSTPLCRRPRSQNRVNLSPFLCSKRVTLLRLSVNSSDHICQISIKFRKSSSKNLGIMEDHGLMVSEELASESTGDEMIYHFMTLWTGS